AQRVHPGGRLVLVVLAPVDEDLVLSQSLAHVGDDLVGELSLQCLGDCARERFGLIERYRSRVEGNRQVNPLATGSLGEGFQFQPIEKIPHLKRDTRRLDYAGGWAGVEIEDHHRWLMHFRRSREQWMKLERGKV